MIWVRPGGQIFGATFLSDSVAGGSLYFHGATNSCSLNLWQRLHRSMDPPTQSQIESVPLVKIEWWLQNGIVPRLRAGYEMTNTFWLLEMQGLLVSEVGILVCHQKLDKHPTRDQTAWEQYKKRTLAVSVPPGRE